RRPDLPRPYRVSGYPLVPAIFLLASLYMVVNALLSDVGKTGLTLLVILVGIPVYWLRARWLARSGTAAPRAGLSG
ncbi:MAG: hypothetical protein JO341_06790, partial [Gammaproteobacteria bacterium]|nr:hypothetical protein [Gammaproteobacteria bacterium]